MESTPLLDAATCQSVVAAVLALRPAWVTRHPLAPFFTLGAASYLDASGPLGAAPYLEAANRLNPLLDAAFAPLFAAVVGALAKRLGVPVVLSDRQSRPGFHIFLGHPAFQDSVAQVHCDLQHELLNWGEHPPASETLSFTLPVTMPPSGGGMDVWPITQAAWLALSPAERQASLKAQTPALVPYTAGTLVLHTGQLVHRISRTHSFALDDQRITLQGHGIRLNGTWQLYW
jgi:hypothetical protein